MSIMIDKEEKIFKVSNNFIFQHIYNGHDIIDNIHQS